MLDRNFLFFLQTAQQMDAPGYPVETNVCTLSMEKKTASRATPMRVHWVSAMALVHLMLWNVLSKDQSFTSLCLCLCCFFWFILGLLTIQSAEENDFVINYSREVWNGTVIMWLGMYFDTDSKDHMSQRSLKTYYLWAFRISILTGDSWCWIWWCVSMGINC